MTKKDLYEILGVARDATPDQIRSAYRKLARAHHPDVNPNDPQAEERFKEISFANGVLSDEEKRKLYDEFGHDGLAEGFDPETARAYQRWSRGAQQSPNFQEFTSDIDLEDLLSGFFSGGARFQGGARGATGPRRGPDAEGRLDVDFLDAALGREVSAHFEGRPPLQVKIPAGAETGQRIRLAGMGGPGRNDGEPGDLYLTLHVRPHRFFERDGRDVIVDLPVTLPEMIRGASVRVPTLDGEVTLTIPAGSKNGQKMRLKGKGIRDRKSGEAGDLFVRLSAAMPEKSDDRLREIADELESYYEGRDVRHHLEGGA